MTSRWLCTTGPATHRTSSRTLPEWLENSEDVHARQLGEADSQCEAEHIDRRRHGQVGLGQADVVAACSLASAG